MDPVSSLVRRAARPIALLLTIGAALALPSSASAKVFVSHFTDQTGDGRTAGTDITNVRVAYNRKSGALSATLTVDGTIDTTANQVFVVFLSDLVGGKCQQATTMIGGVFSHPDEAVAQRMRNGKGIGKQYVGDASLDDDNTFTVKVKSRALAGLTPGCAFAAIATSKVSGDLDKVYDQTKSNNGFFG
ncbi:MAG: hypothetical protein AAGC46_14160 [Solirubrobacteraceae bacterium]|nr:hypothetical protein [Patulibacter sp.]